MPEKKTAKRAPRKPKAKPVAPVTPEVMKEYEEALEEFAQAVELLREGKLADARSRFEAIEKTYHHEPELVDRARTYAAICSRKLAPPPEAPAGPEEAYLRAVARANEGQLEEALSLIEQALAARPGEATYLYVRASIHAMARRADSAVADLRRALELDPDLRYQAVNDPDFSLIRDDAAFIDLIEPSSTGERT